MTGCGNCLHNGCRSRNGTNTSMDIANHISDYVGPNVEGGRASGHGVLTDNDEEKGQCRVDGIRTT
jgi:hypothetical protein